MMSTESMLHGMLLSASLVILTSGALPAMAQDRPFFVEANIGRTSVDNIDSVAINDSATSYRLGTGYRFSRWFGVAGAYVNIGTIESTIAVAPGFLVPLEASADGFEVALTGHVPVSESFSLTAEFGMLWWTGDTSIDGAKSRENGNDTTFGIGAEYALGATFTITANWRRYTIDDVDADTAWLGVRVNFGDSG